MPDKKVNIREFQDQKFLELLEGVIKSTSNTPQSSNAAIASLVSLGEMCPKAALAIKMMSPPMTILTRRQSALFDFFAFTLDYAMSAQARRRDPLELVRELNTSAISARDKFTSSPAHD